MIILQSNQNNAMVEDSETCYTLVASMGLGGGYVPMIVEYDDIHRETILQMGGRRDIGNAP